MTPDQCKLTVSNEYQRLLTLVKQGALNESAVFGLMESQARSAARHNGVPEAWRNYMPPTLQGEAS